MILKGISILSIIAIVLTTYLCESHLNVRKNVNSLTHKEWQEYKRGIKLMKEISLRNKYDPLGYYYQANIHGWPGYDATERANKIADRYNWHKCQHSSYFFLVWHRMYIFFYERILQKVSNNPEITLPFWDVFQMDSRSLPQPFRIPANNMTNPLYVSQRCKNINEGQPISERIVSPYPALNTNFFTTYKQNNELNLCNSLGGGRQDKPTFASDREGLLERIPHDNVHLFVGGPNGHMSDLCQSARDPIFFNHHSNIDRIWESWVAAGGQNLIESQYLNQTFDFYDETGELNSYRIGDFLDITALGYRYESLIKTVRLETIRNERPKLYVAINEKEDLVINYNKRFINLHLKPQWISFFEKYVSGQFDGLDIKFTLQFDLDYIQSNIIFEMYLNLDPNTTPVDSHPNFVGAMVSFEGHCVPRVRRDHLSISKCYDISQNLQRILKNDYNFNGFIPNTFNLTFVSKFCDKTFFPKTSQDLIQFNEILLVFYRVDEIRHSMSNYSQEFPLNTSAINNNEKDWEKTLRSIPDI